MYLNYLLVCYKFRTIFSDNSFVTFVPTCSFLRKEIVGFLFCCPPTPITAVQVLPNKILQTNDWISSSLVTGKRVFSVDLIHFSRN